MDSKAQTKEAILNQLNEEIKLNGKEWEEDPNCLGAQGMTMFDLPNSQDNLITVLIPKKSIRNIGSQSIVEIRSRSEENGGDDRIYRGIVVAGPFHEPDGMRADSPTMIATAINGAVFMPNFHGRIMIELLGELKDGILTPPKFRPLPNSPVFVLDKAQTMEVLKVADGNIVLGQAIGHDGIEVKFPADKKTVLPRHMGILGTTGGGKSTTVSSLISQFQKEKIATIIIDTEGEYTHIDRPTEADNMKKLLEIRGLSPAGVGNVTVYHLLGRDTRAESPTISKEFNLRFWDLSPYAATDILGLTEAQFSRFFKVYDTAKLVLKDLGIFPKKGEEKNALEVDEFESGYPHITLSLLIDIAGMILEKIAIGNTAIILNRFFDSATKERIKSRIEAAAKTTDNESSWKALIGKLWQLHRTGVFDKSIENEMPYQDLIKPGHVSIIDLSDSDSTLINNIVIANLLRGIQQSQEKAYENALSRGENPTAVSIFIEEAHEFLSKERISKMSNLFEQVARIARRGRKRWLGLVFVTQLPQHLPDEVLGLINSFILHKINDAGVISRLKRSIGGVDEGMWYKLPNLAPGQAIVTMPSLARPLLIAMDPTSCKLLMVD